MRIYTDEKDRLLSIWLSAEETTMHLSWRRSTRLLHSIRA